MYFIQFDLLYGYLRSVGCIIYELAALHHAFEAKTLMGVMYQIIEVAAPKFPEDYSDALADVYYA